MDRLIQEDQAQLAISDISGQVREAIARKREEAIQKKKTREAARHVVCENYARITRRRNVRKVKKCLRGKKQRNEILGKQRKRNTRS